MSLTYDNVSISYGNGTDICSNRNYFISSTPVPGSGLNGSTPLTLPGPNLTISNTGLI